MSEFKRVKRAMHARAIGKKEDGSTKYAYTEVGVILSNGEGDSFLVLNYIPTSAGEAGLKLQLWDPKKKEEPAY